MTAKLTGRVDALRSAMSGPVFLPGDPEYDSARSVWNGEIDRRPAVIARCRNSADVSAAVRFARTEGLELSVRGGGHNFGGNAVCADGAMIDLSAMNRVSVDPAARLARCAGGATLADLDAATQHHGLAVTGGTVSHTGVGGLTLGGGFGWLTNRLGLTCDNLLAAEVVSADGHVLRASADEHAELFWALRGGGGNFGVVTDFEFRLHPVGPDLHLGFCFWPQESAPEALRTGRDIVAGLPRDFGALMACLNAPPAPFVPEQYHFRLGVALMVVGLGSADEQARMMDTVRAMLAPSVDSVTPIPYTALQRFLDESAPWGILGYEKAHFLADLPDEAVDVVTDWVPEKRSPMSFVPIFPMQGAYADAEDDDTAFGGSRSARWGFNIAALASDPQVLAADRAWVREFWEALLPYAMNSGGYVNFMTENQNDRVRAAYGPAKYARLAGVKKEYDPDNAFHLNANIKPG